MWGSGKDWNLCCSEQAPDEILSLGRPRHMQIHRLKLSGFKSFVEPAELRVEPGLTGVVGPNGCGKSNLLEAIRWVMGESSPRSMRSGGMEDVIFAGTETRPSRDFAEVILQGLDDDQQELEVTRRIEKGAGSAYRINGRDVRAKDVTLTFADAATGAHSPALVSQGKIAQVISAKPTERRQMLEEAAGIAGLHVRRKDAESKLRSTEKNLERLEDLMAGLDTQMASLRRQAKQAERYTKLSNQIRVSEARLLFARWKDASKMADQAISSVEQANANVENAKKEVAELQEAQKEALSLNKKANEQLTDRRDDASAHGHRMATLSSQLEAIEDRIGDLQRQQVRLDQDLGEIGRFTSDASEALSRLERELAASKTKLEKGEILRPDLATKVEKAETEARKTELELAKATADHASVEAEWRVANAEIQQLKLRLERLGEDEARINSQLNELKSGILPADLVKSAEKAAKIATQELDKFKKIVASYQTTKAKTEEKFDEAKSRSAIAKAELRGVKTEFDALAKDRAARDQQNRNVAALPTALEKIKVLPGYERAIAAVLGSDAKSPIGVPDKLRIGRFWAGRKSVKSVPNNLLEKVVDCPSELRARLALVHLIEVDDDRVLEPGEWLVDKEGNLRRWDGFIARGQGATEAAHLEGYNRLIELEEQLTALEKNVLLTQSEEKLMSEELEKLLGDLSKNESLLFSASEKQRETLLDLDRAIRAKEHHERRSKELVEAKKLIASDKSLVEHDYKSAEAKRDNLPSPEAGLVSLEAAKALNEVARGTLQALNTELAAYDQGLAVARERIASQENERASWEARSSDAEKRNTEIKRRLAEIEKESLEISEKPTTLEREIGQGEKIRMQIAEELSAAEELVSKAQASLNEIDLKVANANERLSSHRETRAGLVAKAENEENRRDELSVNSNERFQCLPSLLPEHVGFSADAANEPIKESAELEKLTLNRERIGPVNLVASDELTRLEEEHGSSASEQAELTEAVKRLRGSIGNLNREGRERLRNAFEEVDGHFRKLFTRLFEGGQAHLALIDSDDPLDAGLEIYAQPPGKKLQSLGLLSGGEQALTATALIFALFLTNPAPICVLDEVDAPLDDANIERFCDLLDSMTIETATRYLIVTHNAVTMSRMHRLFGVTMAEKGVSRLVSVDLREAEAMAA